MSKDIKIVATSDWHFGHPRIGTEQLYMELRKYLYPELMDANLCVIAGDIYHQILSVNSKAHQYAFLVMTDLIEIARKNDMYIRILHGTYTHDRDQLGIFNILKKMDLKTNHFRVINNIEVETIKDLDLKIGYLPDNLPYKYSKDAIEQLQKAMNIVGYNKIDLLIGHGAFSHTLPPNIPTKPPCLYEANQFTNIVDGLIIMGHIHNPSKLKNIYYCGSFERFAHGEEDNKGFYMFYRRNNQWTFKFVINKDANLFISIEPIGNDPSQIINNFINKLRELFPEERGHIRVIHNSPEVRSMLHRACNNTYPDIIYTSKVAGDTDKVELKLDNIELDVFDDVKPDIHNLPKLVWKFLEENHNTVEIQEDGIIDRVKLLLA